MNQNLSLPPDLCKDHEISLIDTLRFLKSAWRLIAIAGVLGLAIACAYLLLTPNQYEAVANIAMARIPADKSPLGINVEEPVALINRISVPSGFDATVTQTCGLDDSSNPVAQLSKAIKLNTPKGVADVVELKVMRSSPELAQACADAVYQAIANSQLQMVDLIAQTTRANNSARLAKVEERLSQDKALLVKAEQAKGAVSLTYFAILGEIRNLEDEQEKLALTVSAKGVRTTNLLSPIYVVDKPVIFKKSLGLVAGLMGGLVLGLLLALSQRVLVKLKNEAGGVR